MKGSFLGSVVRRSRRGVACFLFVFSCAGSASAQFTPFEATIARFDAEVAREVAKDAAGCVSVAIFIRNEVIWAKGYGWADIEHRVAATERTIGRTGSISKSFTAVLMMQLAERGILDIDEPVETYFPEIKNLADPPADMRKITFRMLASHTAGSSASPSSKAPPPGRFITGRTRSSPPSRTHLLRHHL